ncbi:nuclear transport factor 2 family protein [Kitasatospora griseola]|uniref:nuclear transport factor 2 family protein n=1 Tax=Kitasatospora griseola TaxID=2064 RepID=UPI0037F6DC59
MPRTDIRAALDDIVFSSDLDLDKAAERHITPDFVQRIDGRTVERDAFLVNMANLREAVVSGVIDMHQELFDGDNYADHHTAAISMKDGSTLHMEVYLFAEFAEDGRFRRINETTLVLEGPAHAS